MQTKLSIILLLTINLAPLSIVQEIFAQPAVTENWQLSSVLSEKESDKGTYLVQLKSSLTHDIHNFPIEVVFLNSTVPVHTPQTVPSLESNNTGDTLTTTGLSTPEILERVIPVSNYDISIYDANGNDLWSKTSQVATEGRGTQNVDFGNYNGNLTIVIDNIVYSQNTNNLLNTDLPTRIETGNNNSNTNQSSSQHDSVTFNTTLSKTS
ncbi:MAG TPA: hypothetical protein VFK40_03575 [Nitrososphaeraceae archaeon]|nr:hypothetical protein [Nitrososphaeraceae archaeon]